MQIIDETVYLKIVFFGTALAGKTTILEWLFNNAIPDEMKLARNLRQLKTSFGQTLVFDFAPVRIANNLVARLYTATGQDYYRATRRQLLDDADGIFLVIDSQKEEKEHNIELIHELRQYMENVNGLGEAEIVVLYNKQDLETADKPENLRERLNLQESWPEFSTCAVTGENLRQGLLEMLKRLSLRLQSEGIEVL
ncbi:ATP/GTP-binding protein [Thermodesulfobacteriota bacterium]